MHKQFWWVVIGLFTLALTPPATVVWAQEASWATHMTAATLALQHRHPAEAGTQLEAALELAEDFSIGDPRLARTLNNLAYIYRRVGRYYDAEPLYQRAAR